MFHDNRCSSSFLGNNKDYNADKILDIGASILEDLYTIHINKGNDIFQYINENIEVVIPRDKWIQTQLLTNELISNVFLRNSARECFVEFGNSSITVIDNGTRFNPTIELIYHENSTNTNMGALVLQNFRNKYFGEVDVTYEWVNNMNRISILFYSN